MRFGNVVCQGRASAAAVVSHQNHASNSNFALRRSNGASVSDAARANPGYRRWSRALAVSATGNVIWVARRSHRPTPPTACSGFGEAFKTAGVGPSDARVKEDVRDLEAGLAALRQVRPVRFRYNGRAGTSPGRPGVGVLAQEIEAVLPETVQRASVPDDPALNDLRVFDSSMLTYVLINAVKELAARVEHLEQALAAATVAADTGSVLA